MRPRGFLTSPCLVEELEARIAGADSQERLSFLVSGHTLCVMIPTVWVHTICGEVNGGLMSFQQSQDTWSRWLGLGYARVQQWNGRLLCTTSCWLCWVENGVSAAPVQGLMGLILLTARGTRWSFKMVACKCFLATDFFPAMSLGWYCGSIIVDHNTSATWAIQLEAYLPDLSVFFNRFKISAEFYATQWYWTQSWAGWSRVQFVMATATSPIPIFGVQASSALWITWAKTCGNSISEFLQQLV